MKKTLILGAGNLLLGDEGIGIHVIKKLEKETFLPEADILDGGTGGFHLISWLREYERIIMVDATLDSHPPGTVRLIRPHYVSDFPPLMSAHETGLRDMLAVMQLTGDMPEIHLIAVSVKNVNDVSMELSPEVAAAIPDIIKMLKELVI